MKLSPEHKGLYDLICKMAEEKTPCPTNEWMGIQFSRSSGWAYFALNSLEQMGLIKLANPDGHRLIIVTKTAKSTGPSKRNIGRLAYSERSKPTADDDSGDVIISPYRFSPAPCARCGARPGMCQHGAPQNLSVAI